MDKILQFSDTFIIIIKGTPAASSNPNMLLASEDIKQQQNEAQTSNNGSV